MNYLNIDREWRAWTRVSPFWTVWLMELHYGQSSPVSRG